ncbi:hypothetical protein HF670_11930 [Acidithiobacillus thiooxidans]|uniref:Uncharacterized protein n=2 Tax=Acidithiobacillus thiooxidans TaxID=930 RepID=A0A1C2HWT8_ACITH|nr:hypothetical protein [Acidithiobacillus thiooxidans]MBU2836959.1 hypothetical protein [Acidithiobacillus thiooxidans]MBU2840255.1 hypothetical protein [Acidithiobacillus thiooxidans]OCX68191.1 hypothetical protein A6M23_18840 [Acidithiobacillus thiooxidans]OCX82298.1 hypothetical protein A6P08_12270 [Acidithiobacillus thiooxidans]QFX96729.1 hypothetical protein GCD22_02544 [Acidithiobacillus thiooxidans ATCC 19377]
MKTDQEIMKSHTTGPWQAKRLGAHDAWVVLWPDKGGEYMRRLDDKGQFTEADAKLIAALPELLEAAIQINALSIQGEAHKRLREILHKMRDQSESPHPEHPV